MKERDDMTNEFSVEEYIKILEVWLNMLVSLAGDPYGSELAISTMRAAMGKVQSDPNIGVRQAVTFAEIGRCMMLFSMEKIMGKDRTDSLLQIATNSSDREKVISIFEDQLRSNGFSEEEIERVDWQSLLDKAVVNDRTN